MSDANFASLSPTLLARKGGAKPAMRPQSGVVGPVNGEDVAANLEDLGWNDMGDESVFADAPAETNVSRPSPRPREAEVVQFTPAMPAANDAPNQVRASLDRIAAQLESPAADRMARAATSKSSKRAAFTLRLDHDRHLMLRLACTVRNRSAQQLVTDALDALLDQMPEIAQLAAQVPRDDD